MLVILFGAVVRITGSGAGCGQHWPTCHGEVAHLPKTTATAIELTHRLTSGLSAVLVVGVAVLVFRRFPAGAAPRRLAAWAAALMLTESLIGAALVLLRLVGENTSVARAMVMSLHLVNTSLLTAAIALTAWTAERSSPFRWRPRDGLEWALAGSLFAVLAVSTTGAITALGDTLYPVQEVRTVAERLAADHGPAATFLERGRAIHPVVAVLGAAYIAVLARKATESRPRPEVQRNARVVLGLVSLQVVAGIVNVWLSAPAWMQVLHLGLATVLWIGLVLLYVAFENEPEAA